MHSGGVHGASPGKPSVYVGVCRMVKEPQLQGLTYRVDLSMCRDRSYSEIGLAPHAHRWSNEVLMLALTSCGLNKA